MQRRIIQTLLAIVIIVGLAGSLNAGDLPAQAANPDAPLAQPDIDALLAKARAQGRVPIIVGLRIPGQPPNVDMSNPRAVADQRAAIAQTQDALLNSLAAHNVTEVKKFAYVSFMAMTVDATALQALQADPQVTSIEEDIAVPPLLTESIPLIQAHYDHILNYTGSGQTIAVLDTGVDRFHPALAGKVVSGACYSSNNATDNATSLCPGGATSATTLASGANCATSISGCDHGTHVAGIAAGVAPGASLISIQVFSRRTDVPGNTPCANVNRTSPCTLSYTSDLISALNRVFALRNSFNIASVNMSLGGGQYSAACDTLSAGMTAAINSLRNVGIATVIAAGNSGFVNSMGWPACISTAISVGATDKFDQVASYSNLAPLTTLLAPGSNINAPIPGTDYLPKNGTSMAAPHVAGAVAILKQVRPNATVPEITTLLSSTGTSVTDLRSGGFVTKRRLNAYVALCGLITCDGDDYRTLLIEQTLSGSISPSTDRDHFFYNGQAGERLSLRMNRTSGNLDPYLELFDPLGTRVALNNNGGGNQNALINGYTLQQTGRYLLVARGVGGTGGYQVQATREVVPLNPAPRITRLNPSSATATPIGSDFWVAIHGSGFIPQSEVRWNGSLRSKYYSSDRLMYMRVRGSDINFPAPRTASVTVRNPAPGGGTSNTATFAITFPFLGESELVAPESGSSVAAGLKQTFVISWTHPTDSWRVMQNMDLRLRDENNNTALWVRLVEGQPDSRFRLLNSSEGVTASEEGGLIDEGLAGEDRDLVLTDTVRLHLAETSFFGSGRTIVMTPTVTFDPSVVGTYNIEFRVDNEEGEVQADDVLGTFSILPEGCTAALTNVSISGPASGTVNTTYNYSAAIDPPDATTPISYTWVPEPQSGQGTASAGYSWDTAGEHVVSVSAENCGSFVADAQSVAISTGTAPDLAISKAGPATALAGEPITYTLTITNSGATAASNLTVVDTIPTGATYVSGGTPSGDTVTWTIPSLAGSGAVTQTRFVVTAPATIRNSDYFVTAAGGHSASGSPVVETQIVDARAEVTPILTATLAYVRSAPLAMTEVIVPAGAVFDNTTVTYRELIEPGNPLPAGATFAGRAFLLEAYREGRPIADLTFGEAIAITLTYSQDDLADIDENLLGLYYWDGRGWSADGVTCERDTQQNELRCTALTPPGEFALLARSAGVYLPLVVR